LNLGSLILISERWLIISQLREYLLVKNCTPYVLEVFHVLVAVVLLSEVECYCMIEQEAIGYFVLGIILEV
jgi:hypothetical protein